MRRLAQMCRPIQPCPKPDGKPTRTTVDTQKLKMYPTFDTAAAMRRVHTSAIRCAATGERVRRAEATLRSAISPAHQ